MLFVIPIKKMAGGVKFNIKSNEIKISILLLKKK